MTDKPEIHESQNDQLYKFKHLEKNRLMTKEMAESKRKRSNELGEHKKAQQSEKTSDYGDALSKQLRDTPDEKKEVWRNKHLENIQLTPKEMAESKRKRSNELNEHKKLESIYTEYMEGVKHSQVKHIESTEKLVDANKIHVPEEVLKTRNPDDPQFWLHHNNSQEDYIDFAKDYAGLKNKFEQGATIEELRKGEQHKGAVNFWFGDRPIELVKYKENYFLEGSGNHRVWLAKTHHLGDVPVHVNEAQETEKQ